MYHRWCNSGAYNLDNHLYFCCSDSLGDSRVDNIGYLFLWFLGMAGPDTGEDGDGDKGDLHW